jgi:hypothetical protein
MADESSVVSVRILAFSSVDVSVSKRPCVSMRMMARLSPCRKTSDQKERPVVSRIEPERHEKPVRGSFLSPSHVVGLESGLLGLLRDLNWEFL